jgi:hypothetical protein
MQKKIESNRMVDSRWIWMKVHGHMSGDGNNQVSTE